MNIRQTDLSNLQIDWTDRTRLTFSIEQTTDEISATYQALLDKFKKEVREESYKYLDIQYQDYRLRRRGIIGIAWSNLNEWWWNYGYDKNLILRHTLELLGLFFIINQLLGKKLYSFYPIIRFDPGNRWARPYRFYTRYLIRVFLLTLLIFFSIRVDFNRIDSSRTRMLLYFFVQYFLGLLCLFFLFNALLKIG